MFSSSPTSMEAPSPSAEVPLYAQLATARRQKPSGLDPRSNDVLLIVEEKDQRDAARAFPFSAPLLNDAPRLFNLLAKSCPEAPGQ